MKKLAAIGALGLLASTLFAQGLNTGGQTKEDWEEINFEFNSAILSDGYPSLLRLADLLKEHPEYRVTVTGNTDYVGSARYNDRLALQRAEAVKAFLVHYGVSASQITASGEGKRAPEVDNRTKEGRFMNRRVVLKVTTAQGQLVKEGGISDILSGLQDFMKRQQECCDQILKRLDKLDDILAALKNLQGENDKLRGELADLRNQHNALRDQVAALPKPLTQQETQTIAHTEATGAVDEAQRRNKKFSMVGIDIGPAFGPGRMGGDFTLSGHGQFFSPFGGDKNRAIQAQGEFLYYPSRKEGQFDIGLVNRWKDEGLQAGAFASFKYVSLDQYKSGGSMAQVDLLLDYIFKGGRIGGFITRGFKNYAILNSVTLAPGAYLQTFARVVNQQGVNFLVGAWGSAFISGNAAYLQLRETHNSRPGGELKLTQPLNERFALTAAARYNTSLITPGGSGELVFGVEMGNYIRPADFNKTFMPVPMDIPRIRYEIGTRRVGASPPIADAGPNQTGISAGTVTLNGCNSYDPLGETLTYSWLQVAGPSVTLSNPAVCNPTFTATAGQSYSFRLTVTNTDHLSGTSTTTVTTSTPSQVQVTSFTASPATITAGQCSTLSWSVANGTSAAITPGVGNVDARTGSVSVCPTSTTTYTLTATNANGTTTATQVVTVSPAAPGNPQIVRFEASPLSIQPGQSTTLTWATNGASTVSISPNVGNVAVNGSTPVSPKQTTTYTLTATSSDGKSVTSPVTVIVAPGQIPQVAAFTANPAVISAGQSSKLCWQVVNATQIAITGVGTGLNANDCATVTPSTTTTYTLTASNASGQIQANVTITVGATQILSFTSDPPYSLKAGTPVVLSWTTTNATSVVIVANSLSPQTLPPNGSLTVNPEVTTAYTLTAYGPAGQTVSNTISVVVR